MKFQEIIQQQVGIHQRLNLLYSGRDLHLEFTGATKNLINKIFIRDFSERKVNELVEFAGRTAISSFYHLNQYYQFNDKAEKDLKEIYLALIKNIYRMKLPDFSQLAQIHFSRLQQWLIKYQPESCLLYPSDKPFIKNKIVCADYDPAFQINLLQMNPGGLQGPILDIGCSKEHRLVDYLHGFGYSAFGIDREITTDCPYLMRIGWFDYFFEREKWGTIVSHLAFSNHFRHHHLKQHSDYKLYAVKYSEILQSLQIGGSFYYAPDLPFIESFLEPKQYQITKNVIGHTAFQSTKITRLY